MVLNLFLSKHALLCCSCFHEAETWSNERNRHEPILVYQRYVEPESSIKRVQSEAHTAVEIAA